MDRNLIDMDSLKVDGIDMEDYPDFCDAYFSEGFYLDGTELPDIVLEELSNDGELMNKKVFDTLY
jgi:predicted NAD/FAD-binding protein